MPQQSALTEERNSERMNFRVKPRIKAAIQRAAALSGVDDSVFVMSAAYNSAVRIIELHEQTVLSAADHAAFFAALDGNSAPNEKLRKALNRHSETIDSRS
jgi:uncharacterized protein (DUF1778 family)